MVAIVNGLGGLATLNRFVVQITPPSTLAKDMRTLSFLCETVNLPGITFGTDDIKQKGYGITEKRASSIGFEDVTCTFFIDNSGICLSFFQKWAQLITSFDPNHSRDLVNDMSLESFNYPEEYWGTVTIYFMDTSNNNVSVYTLDKVWPSAIGSVTLGWESNDSLARIPITFNYRSFSTDNTLSTEKTSNPGIDSDSNYRNLASLSVADAVAKTTQSIV